MNAFRVCTGAAAVCLVLSGTLVCTPRPASAASPAPGASPTATSSSTPAPAASGAVDPKVLTRARSWYDMLESGSIDRSQLTKDMDAAMTPDKVSQIAANLKLLGTPTSFTQIDSAAVSAYTVYHYRVGLASGALVMTLALDASGKIAGINLRPDQATP
jgi:hypothetical protein